MAAPPPGDWLLTFEDEFEGESLDGSKWKLASHWSGINGQGGIDPDRISVVDGVLSITASTDATTWSSVAYAYSTGEISSFRRFKQRYGYFEARMRWPSIRGLWPAFWTMPDRGNYGNPFRHNRGFVKFDLSSESLATINSATLRLSIANLDPATLGTGDVRNVLVFRMADDSWSETSVTWNTQPSWDPLFLDQFHGVVGQLGDTIEVDVTDYIESEAGGDGVVSFALADTLMTTFTVAFHSRESESIALRPQLIINGTAYEATEDSYVNLGRADQNYGSEAVLNVGDFWGNTAMTTNGGMEIDIVEALGVWGSQRASHALHWEGYNNGNSVKQTGWGVSVNDTSKFHTYGVYWEPGLLEFYTDGILTGVFRDSRVKDIAAYMLLSLQIGGWAGNDQISPAIDGAALEVDWVRVWAGTRDARERDFTMQKDDGSVLFGNDYASYGSQGIEGHVLPSADGFSVDIKGNSWIRFPIIQQIGPKTVLEFELDATDLGEIFAIGLDQNNQESDDLRTFQLGGTQAWGNSIQAFNSYVKGSGPKTYSIPIGDYYTGTMTTLAIVADDDGDASIDATFHNVRIREAGVTSASHAVSIGALGSGVAGTDWRGGTGFLMYSAEDVYQRFDAYSGNANNVIAVYFSNGQWYADRNYGQVAFAPTVTDVLLARIDFSNDTTTSLQGQRDSFEGIHYGYASGDLAYAANVWNGGGENPTGEFSVSGTGFSPHVEVPLPLPSGEYGLTPLNEGIAGTASRTNTGYLMYSGENAHARFNVPTGNAQHLVAVYCTEGQWYYDSGSNGVAFSPRPTDILLAAVHFRDDTIITFTDEIGKEHGMQKGYIDASLSFTANQWDGQFQEGSFTVTGETFRRRHPLPLELYNAWRIARDWQGTASLDRILWKDADKDGKSNFVEFALGSNPLQVSQEAALSWSAKPTSVDSLMYKLQYPKAVDELDYRLQYSEDLIVWLESGFSPEVVEGQIAERQLVMSDDGTPVFFRLMFPGIPDEPRL
ncbi:DUF7594 domain-containing protein [Rubellicoccus peritrichatus]|uniref:Family 16 glycosylhydrolase n=1 Tax=Rubellicoccus peritrichatus TaxID=3080537 RepID=A0AAQ3QUS5_9BACT|nr:DNRLRE domain-containing protein [Puniceicoccus sp. CR14]WOO40097.1 family 16 glycosylhydrolase [Puniceicoccus sp. CR14]